MRPPPIEWNRLFRLLTHDPRPKPLRSRRRRTADQRPAPFQVLEARELLTASMQILDGATQLSAYGSDSFDPATVGDVATKTFTVNDTGDEDLTIGSLELPTGFSPQTALPLDVPAGGSSSFTVSMDTSMATSYDGEMEVDSDDPNSPFYLDLSGTVNLPPPALTVLDGTTTIDNDPSGMNSPDDFGTTSVGTPVEKTFEIDNSGSSDISVSNLSLPSGFSLVGSFPASVPADGSATFAVQIDASSISTPSGELSFSDTDLGGGDQYQFALSGTVVAPPPVITVLDGTTSIDNDPSGMNSPDDFGTTSVGTVVDKSFEIDNSGSSAVSLSNLSLPSGFSLVGSFANSVPADGSATFSVQLDATSISTPSGELSFGDTDLGGGDQYQFGISGTVVAPPPVISVLDGGTTIVNDPSGMSSPDDFGTTTLGTPADKTFEITNSASSDIGVSNLILPGGFSLVGSFPTSVPANGSTTFTVQLDATSLSTPSGELVFSDNDLGGGDQYQFGISGTVVAPPPVISVLDGGTTIVNDPSGMNPPDDFGATPFGTPVDKTFTIVNSGASNIAITSGSLSLPSGFSLVGTFPGSVSAHGSVPFTVAFSASSPGTTSGELSFRDTDLGGDFYQFAVSGTAAVPELQLYDQGSWLGNGGSDDFGPTDQGSPIQKQFTISNAGEAPLSITPNSLVLPAGYSLVGAMPASVAAGASASFTVQLNATTTGTVSGSLSFRDNDPDSDPFSITLTGVVNALTGDISVTDAGTPVVDGESQIDFGTTDADTPALQSFVIQNTGSVPLTLNSQTLPLPAGFQAEQVFSSTVAPGASTTLVIELNSSQGGDFGGLASFDTSDRQHPTFSFFVSGQVNPPEPVLQVLAGTTTLSNGENDDFGSTTLGATIVQTLTIENQGNADLDLDTHSIMLPPGFSVVTPFAPSVAPGGSTTLVIELGAAAGGDFSGALDFSTNDPTNGDFSLELSGVVLAPAITVLDGNGNAVANNTGTVDFGSTPLGLAVSQVLTIENTGAADLTLDPASLVLPGGYSVENNFSKDVPPGGSTSLTVQLNATSAGTASGQAWFKDGDPNNSPFQFTLTGVVTAPSIEVLDGTTALASGSDDDFGGTTLGAPAQRTLTIENNGQAPLTLDASSLVVPNGFSVVTPFAGTVAPGGSTTLVLQLDAASAGLANGVLTFVDNDPLIPVYKLNLSGQVLAPLMQVVDASTVLANGTSVSLGTTTVGNPLDLSLMIGDIGLGTLNLDPASIVVPGGFSLVRAFASSVAPATGTRLVIALTATAPGNYSGTLSFTSNDSTQNPFQLTLSGAVDSPAISVLDGNTAIANGGTEDLGLTPVGTSAQKELTIKNNGTADLTIDTADITLPDGFSLVTAPAATIAAGASSTMIVQLDANDTGDYTGAVVVPSNDPTYPDYSFTLSGHVLLTAATLAVLNGATALNDGDGVTFPATQTGLPVSETLTLENLGYPSLSFDTSSLTLPAGYSVVTPFAGSIAGGGSTTLVIQLDAAAAGSYTGGLGFNYGTDPSNPATYDSSYGLTLDGTVTDPAPVLRVTNGGTTLANGTSTVTFPAALVGSPTTETLAIYNDGAGALAIDTSSIALPSGFSVVSAPASSVAAGGSTSMTLQLDATVAGEDSGSLSFNWGDGENSDEFSYSVTLAGTVTAAAPALSVQDGPTTLVNGTGTVTFPAALTGDPTTATLTLTNTGTAELDLDAGSLTLPAGFSVVTPFATTVAVGASTSLVVQLDASSAGDYSGTLAFNWGDDQNADEFGYTVTLSGTVGDPTPGISLTDLDDGSALANGGAVAFGSTATNGLPLYSLLEIQNTGTGTLSLDPSSLVVPAGFNVFQTFAASVAAGSETFLWLALPVDVVGDFSGTVSFNYGFGGSQNADEYSYGFTVSGTVTAPVPADISIDNVVLPSNIGPRSDATTADPTLAGTVDGTFNGGSVVVQFSVVEGSSNPGPTVDGATAAMTAGGTGFTFDPRTADPSLVGYLGPVDVTYRAQITDAAGNVSYGDWTDFDFTLVAAPSQAHVDNLALVNDSGSSDTDLATYDPRVTAQVGGPFVGVTVDVEFVVGDGAGNPAGTLPADPANVGTAIGMSAPGESFTYDPASDDPALAYYAGPVALSYRPVEYDGYGNVVATGAWNTFNFTLYTPTPQASVSNFHVVQVTGTEGPPPTTSDPTVAGTLTGTFTNEIVEVQFSNRGDGQIDGVVTATAAGTDFTYDPRTTDPSLNSYTGTLNLAYRTVELDAHGGQIAGAWVSFPIIIVQQTTSATIENLGLSDVTGAAGPPATTDDPTVTGIVVGQQTQNTPQVQFDYDGNGIPDETISVNSDGTFSDSLPGLPYGEVTIQARVVEYDSTQGVYLYGAWTPLSFNYVPPPPPSIASLTLANVTDATTGGTSDPSVVGEVDSGQGSVDSGQSCTVQFDTNGDGLPDGTTLTDMQGNFSFTPVGLSYGSVTIAARTVQHGTGPLTYSPWVTLTFSYEAPPAAAPSVTSLTLANPSTPGATTTTDPTVTGVVAYNQLQGSGEGSGFGVQGSGPTTADILSQNVDFLTVQFDFNGDGVVDASTTTDPGGTFTFTPTGLAYAQDTIRARAVGQAFQPDGTIEDVYGDWTSLTFTYQQAPSNVATVSSLTLASPLPLGEGQGEGGSNPVATDPMLSGQLSAPSVVSGPSSVAFLTVEFDTTGDGQPDASVQTDANGAFTFTPTDLSYGTVTVAARVRQHDYTTGGFDYSAWTTITFTYQAPADAAAPSISSLSLLDDSGTSWSDGVTANPAVRGAVSSLTPNPQSLTPFVEIDTNGDGVPDATVFPDANGNFTYTPTGLDYGAVTIAARAVGQAFQPDGSVSYVYSDWTSLSFTYQQQAYAAPVMAGLGLVDANGKLVPVEELSASYSDSQPVIGGELTYQGSVNGLTVEIDTTGHGTANATATTDQYGDFQYTPVGLTPGVVTIYVRAVGQAFQPDGSGTAPMVGAWTPITFTYVAPAIAPPSVTSLVLADDTGTSSSDNITTDPAVSGVAASLTPNPQSLTPSLLIQFDVNGAAAPYPTTVADSSGNFSWTPMGLAAGQVTIEARAVDDDANGNAIYGPWTSLTFTLQAIAPAAATVVASLALADNVGPSSSALVSTDGAISGTVAAPAGSSASVSGVSVEIDLTGSGTPQATVTTDSSGHFSYTPPAGSLPTGVVKIFVRTADQDAAAAAVAQPPSAGGTTAGGGGSTTTYATAGVGTVSEDASSGYWTSLSFVLSSSPTSGTVQAQAETLADSLASEAQAAANSQSASDGAASALSQAQTTAAGAYNTSLAQASGAQQSATQSATVGYNSALASAQSTYQSAMNQASENFNNELASYPGDTTSFSYQPYAWPDAPPPLPGPDQTTATPPVEAPTFDGTPFDPTQDPTYASTIQIDQQAYDTGVQGANDGYRSDADQAAQDEQDAISLAEGKEQQAFQTADDNYQTAMDVQNPYDLTAAANKLAGDDQAAVDQYDGKFLTANGVYLSALVDAFNTYVSTVTPDYIAHDNAYAANEATELAQLSALTGTTIDPNVDPAGFNAAYQKFIQQQFDIVHQWAMADGAADVAWTKELDAAMLTFDKSVDAALEGHDASVADALLEEQQAFDAAEVASAATGAEWRQWNAQQKADADEARQKAYDLAIRDFQVAVALAQQGDADAVALAAQKRDDLIADAVKTQREDDATALEQAGLDLVASVTASVGNALSGAGQGSALAVQGSDEIAWAGYQSALAGDEAQYDTNDALAQHTLAYAEDQAAYDDAIPVDQANETRDETIADDEQTEQDDAATATDDLLVGQSNNDETRAEHDATAWQTWNDDRAAAFNSYAHISDSAQQTGDDTWSAAWLQQQDDNAQSELDYITAFVTLGLPPPDSMLEAEYGANLQKYLTGEAASAKNYLYGLADAFQTQETLDADADQGFTDAICGDLADWSDQDDTLAGDDEIAVGTALANQDRLDTAARDDADETAADQAAGEVGADAVAQQHYNDTDAGDQDEQDVSDVEAQQTFEETESDDYMNALQSWVVSLTPNPQSLTPVSLSATEQYQQAVADDAWVHSVTGAQVLDVEEEDGAQITWATTVDEAAQVQETDDAEAMAAAIVDSDQADAQNAVDRDTAWTTEVEDLAGATTTYDQASTDASAGDAEQDAAARHTVQYADRDAMVTRMKADADAYHDLLISGDAQACITATLASAKTLTQTLAANAQTWVDSMTDDEVECVQTVSDAKQAWVKGMTNAEAGYVAAAATANATETKTDAGLAATMDGTLAGDEETFELGLEGANVGLDGADGSDEEGLVHGEAEANADDEVGYAQATADDQTTLWNNDAQQLQTAAAAVVAGSPDPATDPAVALANYYATVAQIEAGQIAIDGTDLVNEETEISGQEVALGDEEEVASVDETNADDVAQQNEMITLLPEEVQATEDADGYLVDEVGNDADAQAAYQTSVAKAAGQFYQDKAQASDVYDNALADAGGTSIKRVAGDWVADVDGTMTLAQVMSDASASSNAYNASYQAARISEIGGYGDAEISEATSLGDAEEALATAQGDDEVGLAGDEAQVADTLTDETVTADETLGDATADENAGNAQTVAGDEADTTTNEGGEETGSEQELADEDVSTATALAGAQADYAIALAQIASAAAASSAQANPSDSQAAFDAVYAQGYVEWLTDLKPAFVADATAVAQAAAGTEEALLAEDVTLADQEATDNVNFVESEAPQAALESETLAQEGDAYTVDTTTNVGQNQVGTAEADQTQMNDLAEAGSVYLVADAEADKQAQLDYANNVPNANQNYKDALAEAKLTLTDSQADADLAWIEGKTLADEEFLTTDAGDWQSMSDGEAATSDQYALLDDGETQSENDGVALDESGELTAGALADETQGNADAAADANFQVAQAAETAAIWEGIVAWASPTTNNPNGMPGLPWMQSQADLASAEASWAVTSAANYEFYVSQLGAAEMNYATTNATDFYDELQTIDSVDKTAADGAAGADEQLSTTLTDDEAAFEEALAPASMDFDDGVAEAQHDDRQAIALADYNLAVASAAGPPSGAALEAYNDALELAQTNEQDGYDLAYLDFGTQVAPAMTLQGTDDAGAEELDSLTTDDEGLTDIQENNAAVDGYQDEESSLYQGQQDAQAEALDAYQLADAIGHAAAIAAYVGQAFQPDNPWGDLAVAQAQAQATQQIAEAAATLAQSLAQAGAQESDEQAQNDATEAEDNANAEAEDTQSDSDAESQDAEQVAQAEATDAVFEDLPDTLIAPADGPALSLTPDFESGYEANDYYLGATQAMFDDGANAVLQAPLDPSYGEPPDFTPPDLGISSVPYGAEGPPSGYAWWDDFGQPVHDLMPWGLVGEAQLSATMADATGADEIIDGVGSVILGVPTPFNFRDPMRAAGSPYEAIAQNYATAMHDTGIADGLLDISNTPSATGIGGYSQSQIPTTITSTDLASTAAPSKNEASTAAAAPETPGGGSGGGTETPPANEETPPAEPDWMGGNTSSTGDTSTEGNVGVTVTIAVFELQPDPNKEPGDVEERTSGEPETKTDQTQEQLANPDNTAETTPQQAYGPPVGGAAGTAAAPSAANDGDSGAASSTASENKTAANESSPGTVVIVVLAASPREQAPRIGGDPNSPFTLPVSDGVAADHWLMNLGLSATDGYESGSATTEYVPPAPEPMRTAQELAIIQGYKDAKERGDELGQMYAKQAWAAAHNWNTTFGPAAGQSLAPKLQYGLTWEQGALYGAAGSMPKLLGGVVVVGLASVFLTPATGFWVGVALLGGSAASSGYSRAQDGQSAVQAIGGGVTDALFITPISNGWTGKDLWTQKDLGLNEFQEGQLFGNGAANFITITVPMAAAAAPGAIRIGGRIIETVGSYRITFDPATVSMNGLGGVRLRRVATAETDNAFALHEWGNPDTAPCFPAEALVHTPDGLRQIDQIQEDDMVLAYDSATNTVVSRKVTAVMKNWTTMLVKIIVDGETIWATKIHPFYLPDSDEWKPACDLRAGMRLLDRDLQSRVIDHVEHMATYEDTFNISVAEFHTFFVGKAGLLVHNSSYETTTTAAVEIYVIFNPDGEVVYVGQTMQGLQVRFQQHINTDHPHWANSYDIKQIKQGAWTAYEAAVWEQHFMDLNGGIEVLENKQSAISQLKYNLYKSLHNPC